MSQWPWGCLDGTWACGLSSFWGHGRSGCHWPETSRGAAGEDGPASETQRLWGGGCSLSSTFSPALAELWSPQCSAHVPRTFPQFSGISAFSGTQAPTPITQGTSPLLPVSRDP